MKDDFFGSDYDDEDESDEIIDGETAFSDDADSGSNEEWIDIQESPPERAEPDEVYPFEPLQEEHFALEDEDPDEKSFFADSESDILPSETQGDEDESTETSAAQDEKEPEEKDSFKAAPLDEEKPEENDSYEAAPLDEEEPEENDSLEAAPQEEEEPEENDSFKAAPLDEEEPEENDSSISDEVFSEEPAFAPYTRGDWSDITETEDGSDAFVREEKQPGMERTVVITETKTVVTTSGRPPFQYHPDALSDVSSESSESSPYAEDDSLPSEETSEQQTEKVDLGRSTSEAYEEELGADVIDLAEVGARFTAEGESHEMPEETESDKEEVQPQTDPLTEDAVSSTLESAQDDSEPKEVREEADENDDKSDRSVSADLIRGHINTIILRALYDGDKYGYEIITEIERKSHNQYSLKQPSLYSALKRLEKDGYVTSYWGGSVSGGRRKYFSLTDEGKEISERNQSEWEYSRTVIDSLISDKDFNFDLPAPTAVDMRVLKRSTSRVPGRENEEEFEYDEPYDDFETRTESVTTTKTVSERIDSAQQNPQQKDQEKLEAERAAFEEERARFEQSLREREEMLKIREEAGTRREQELLEREFALQAEAERLESEELKRVEEEEEKVRLAKEEAEKARLEQEEALRNEEERRQIEETEAERIRLAAEEAARHVLEEQARTAAEEAERTRLEEEEAKAQAEESERLLEEESKRMAEEEAEKDRLEEEQQKRIAEAEETARQQERERIYAEIQAEQERLAAEEAEKTRIEEEQQRKITEAENAARQEERERVLAEIEAKRLEDEAARQQAETEAARRQAEEEVARLRLEAEERERHIAQQNDEIERARAMALNADKLEQNSRILKMEPFAQERAQYEERIREQAEELERIHARELAEMERRVRAEDEERFRQREHQMIHQNYLNLVRGVRNEEASNDSYTSYYYGEPENNSVDPYVYGNKPEKEREYRSAIQRILFSTIHEEKPAPQPQPSFTPIQQPEYETPLPPPSYEKQEPAESTIPQQPVSRKTEKSQQPERRSRSARSLDGIDFYDLEARASQDGIRITLSGGGKTKDFNKKSDHLVHKGRALFLSALVVFLLCVAEGSLALGLSSRFNLPIFFSFFIWGIGLAVLFITGLLFINRYGERALRQTGNIMVNSIISYAICIIVLLIVALARSIDFTSINDLMAYIIFPAIFLFNIVVFGIAYYLQIRPIHEE